MMLLIKQNISSKTHLRISYTSLFQNKFLWIVIHFFCYGSSKFHIIADIEVNQIQIGTE